MPATGRAQNKFCSICPWTIANEMKSFSDVGDVSDVGPDDDADDDDDEVCPDRPPSE